MVGKSIQIHRGEELIAAACRHNAVAEMALDEGVVAAGSHERVGTASLAQQVVVAGAAVEKR